MKTNSGQFVKGMTPWNKGLFGWQGANRTSFTKEDIESKRQIGKVMQGKDQLVCVSEEKTPVRSRNGKVYILKFDNIQELETMLDFVAD